MVYIGIDPGVAGGIAALDDDGAVLAVTRMPPTIPDVLETLIGLAVPGATRAVLERVNAGVFGQQKTGRMGVVSAFTFGKMVGSLQTALTAARIPYDEALPMAWQNALACRSRGDKNVTKARAQQLFPAQRVTHATADALLLAEYCRRVRLGMVRLPPARSKDVAKQATDTELF